MRTLGLLLWALVPILPFLVAGSPMTGVGVAWDVLLLAGLASVAVARGPTERAPVWLAALLGSLWSLSLTYSLALAGSRVATDEQLPLYDLTLLVRPLVVVAADLYGPSVYAAAVAIGLLPLLFTVGSAWLVRRLLPARRLAVLGVASVLLVGIPGSRALLLAFSTDVWRSYQLAGAFDAEREARPHADLQALKLAADPARQPDVHVYVVESYGTAVRGLVGGDDWVALLKEMDKRATAAGWHTAAGVSDAPVHGGRSWIADASVLTGLHVATQSDYERATAMADRIPTLPNFFRDRGYTTVLVRPSDRERPGVMLQNRFGFDKTVFFDDLNYTGPAVGWGHIPDQYSIHVAHRDVIDPVDGPTFAFLHLCTSHLPWLYHPTVYDDPLDVLDRKGRREQILKIRQAHQELRMQAKRFTDDDGQGAVQLRRGRRLRHREHRAAGGLAGCRSAPAGGVLRRPPAPVPGEGGAAHGAGPRDGQRPRDAGALPGGGLSAGAAAEELCSCGGAPRHVRAVGEGGGGDAVGSGWRGRGSSQRLVARGRGAGPLRHPHRPDRICAAVDLTLRDQTEGYCASSFGIHGAITASSSDCTPCQAASSLQKIDRAFCRLG